MATHSCLCQLLLLLLSSSYFFLSLAQMPGFVSIDCGGTADYTDELGLRWTSDTSLIASGTPISVNATTTTSSEKRTQYTTLRAFPADDKKYCYTLNVTTRTRYLLRATFLYSDFDHSSNVFPEFDLYLGATRWSTIVVYDDSRIVTREAIVLAATDTVSVCLSNATTGQPFISTLELRQLNGSLYYTADEASYFLSLAARINFGAPTTDPVRYPDDPYDRIWESDMVRRANYLVDAAPGTTNVSTDKSVFVSTNERPPEKVMQTAVVGSLGELTYRLNLNGFPGNGWAFSYFAEIEEFVVPETRKFKLFIPGLPEVSKPIVDIGENAPGKYRLYEPGYFNASLPFVLSFAFRKTNDSSKGPILNAFEIYKYVRIEFGSPDAPIMASLASRYTFADWAREGGDPCQPSPWSWVKCSSEPQPRVVSINLSGKNLTGTIPPELAALPCLAEIRLEDNMLTGPVPDLTASSNLSIIHFENNQLTGSVPSFLSSLPKLTELYLQNNKLSGDIPKALISRGIILNYAGNGDLQVGKQGKHHLIIIISALLGVSLLLAVSLCCYAITRKTIKKNSPEDDLTKVDLPAQKLQKSSTMSSDIATETAHPYRLCDLEEATKNFANRIGSGGFGIVYYGKLADGREIAVKVPTNDSIQGKKQFTNEVSLLSRIHHRNLVTFLGYCHEDGRNILVYEFMMNGTLKEHLHGRDKHISWIQRLEIAEDSAKGIEYLHSGCTPSIIHRDIKTSNILLDKQMRAKVSDFGLSKFVADESHASTNVRGTLGYLDPQYYTSQQLTEKSDIYSFGIILLELISGRPPISTTPFGDSHFRNIGPWPKFYYESGDIEAIVDPTMVGEYSDVHSVWKVAETAVRCIDAEPRRRPSMAEVVKEVQEAIALERPRAADRRSPFSPAGARSGTVRSHDMIMDNLLYDDSSFSETLKCPELLLNLTLPPFKPRPAAESFRLPCFPSIPPSPSPRDRSICPPTTEIDRSIDRGCVQVVAASSCADQRSIRPVHRSCRRRRWTATSWRRRIRTSAPPPATPRPASTATPPRRRSGAADPPDQSRCATRAGSGTGRGGGWPWGWTRRSSASPRGTPRPPRPPPRPRRRRTTTRRAPTTTRRPSPPRRRRPRRRPWSSTWWGSPRTPCSSSAAGCARGGGSPPASARRSGPPSSSWRSPPASSTPDRSAAGSICLQGLLVGWIGSALQVGRRRR